MVIETNKICAQTLDSVTLRNYKLPHSIHKAKWTLKNHWCFLMKWEYCGFSCICERKNWVKKLGWACGNTWMKQWFECIVSEGSTHCSCPMDKKPCPVFQVLDSYAFVNVQEINRQQSPLWCVVSFLCLLMLKSFLILFSGMHFNWNECISIIILIWITLLYYLTQNFQWNYYWRYQVVDSFLFSNIFDIRFSYIWFFIFIDRVCFSNLKPSWFVWRKFDWWSHGCTSICSYRSFSHEWEFCRGWSVCWCSFCISTSPSWKGSKFTDSGKIPCYLNFWKWNAVF